MTVNHAEVEAQAADWLARRDASDWDEAGQQEFEAWLAQSTAHRVAWLRLLAAWNRADRLVVLRNPRSAPRVGARRASRRDWPSLMKGLAASVGVCVLLVVAFAVVKLRTDAATYQTQIGQQERIALPDGSRMIINTDTLVTTHIDAERRSVELERGEAYFDVAHDATRPFTVKAGDFRVTVLGTKFSLRLDGERLRVVVVEGRVRLETPEQSSTSTQTVIAGGEVAAAAADAAIVMKRPVEQLERDLSWRRGVLVFDQQTLAEVASEFNRYSAQKLVVDERAADIRIGGAFRPDNVLAFAHLLRDSFGLNVLVTQEQILISE